MLCLINVMAVTCEEYFASCEPLKCSVVDYCFWMSGKWLMHVKLTWRLNKLQPKTRKKGKGGLR